MHIFGSYCLCTDADLTFVLKQQAVDPLSRVRRNISGLIWAPSQDELEG